MNTRFRNKLSYAFSLAIVLALLLAPLAAVLAATTGNPSVTEGYDPSSATVDYKAAVKFRSFNNDSAYGAYETILGYDGFSEGSTTIDFGKTTGWKVAPAFNPISFRYNPETETLSTTIEARTTTYSADYHIGDLGPLNYIKIEVAKSTSGKTKVEFNNVTIDGIPLGSFIGPDGGTKQWNVRGLTFTDGFTLTGDVLVSNNVAGQDNAKIEITVGHYDVLGPVTSNVAVSPLPVYLSGQATVSATADDSTYGSNIDFAEFNLDGGQWSDWSLMAATDGTYDSVIENVSADFTAAIVVGKHTSCVRATDNFWLPNRGDPVCQDFLVTYVFDGFFDPVNNELKNLSKAGQAVPVKWRLTDALGFPIDNPASFAGMYSYPVACDDFTEPVDALEEYASGDSGLQYLGDGNWQFNWKTPKTYAASCRAMYVEFDSGTTSDIVMFQFK